MPAKQQAFSSPNRRNNCKTRDVNFAKNTNFRRFNSSVTLSEVQSRLQCNKAAAVVASTGARSTKKTTILNSFHQAKLERDDSVSTVLMLSILQFFEYINIIYFTDIRQ